ncbi:MAG: hypothetical protein QGD89_10195 [Actinomycetota bacterium]|nr:hypothetical protein [Actinomycetota bacterium]
MNAPNPRQLEQKGSICSGLEEALRLSILDDTINPRFFGELPGKVATFLAGVGAGVVFVSR